MIKKMPALNRNANTGTVHPWMVVFSPAFGRGNPDFFNELMAERW